MDTQELKLYLAENPDESAYGLLLDALPNIDRRFQRACRTLQEIIKDVKKHFPDAGYYTASGGLHIVLGETHSGPNTNPNQELSAIGASNGLSIGDGDW